jgi:hypothetical protein
MIFKEFIPIIDCYFEWIDEKHECKIPSFINIIAYSKDKQNRFTFCLCERNNLILRQDIDLNNKTINVKFSKIRELYDILRTSNKNKNIFIRDFINFLKIENRIINIDSIIS